MNATFFIEMLLVKIITLICRNVHLPLFILFNTDFKAISFECWNTSILISYFLTSAAVIGPRRRWRWWRFKKSST